MVIKTKIITVIALDAMMSDRPYRKALTLQKIKQEVLNHSGTQFDPYVVESFIEILDLKGDDILSNAGYYNFQVMPHG